MDKFFSTNGISTGNLQTIGIEDWVLRKGASHYSYLYASAMQFGSVVFVLMCIEFALPLLML